MVKYVRVRANALCASQTIKIIETEVNMPVLSKEEIDAPKRRGNLIQHPLNLSIRTAGATVQSKTYGLMNPEVVGPVLIIMTV